MSQVVRPREIGVERAVNWRRTIFTLAFITLLLSTGATQADDGLPVDTVRAAIAKSIPLLEKASAGSAEQRTCFTCHNQALPVFSLVESKRRGFAVDNDNLERQLRHTHEHLTRGRKDYLEGHGQGGKVLTAGYALWALDAGERKPDETTSAVTDFLLQYQHEDSHWKHTGQRPPSSGSDFTATYVALYGLVKFGTAEQKTRIDARVDTVRKWLLSEKPADTEDAVFRMRSLSLLGGNEAELQDAVQELLAGQRADGGWAQLPNIESDAYATATVIVALLSDGGVSKDNPAVRRAVQYLFDAQRNDGSWHVVTRAKPFQTYYETGYPHGADQFISISAASWATLALLLTLPESP
jgi:N-acyl-D-amino-acid deacylase